MNSIVLRMAMAWLEFLEVHARCIYAPALFGPVTAARLIAKHIKKSDLPKVFQAKHIYDNGWSWLTEKDDVLKGLDALESHGWVRSIEH